MKASFDTSPEELTDFVLRSRSRGYWVVHWGIVAMAATLLTRLLVLPRLGRSPAGYVGTLAIGGILMVALHYGVQAVNRWYVGRSGRRWAERHGRLSISVALEENGVSFVQPGVDVLIRWSEIERVVVGRDGVELWSPEDRLIGLVRTRGFDSEQTMAAFATEVRRRATKIDVSDTSAR